MPLSLQTSRRLHDEHEAVFRLLARFERSLAALDPTRGPNREWNALAREVESAIAHEIGPHFAFEEEHLFALLTEAGEGDLVELLLEEHQTIVAVMTPLVPLLAASRSGTPGEAACRQLKSLGLELCERLTAHAQKEELALLPAMETAIDPDTDAALIERYVPA